MKAALNQQAERELEINHLTNFSDDIEFNKSLKKFK